MPYIRIDDEIKTLLTYIKALGGYETLQDALENSIDDYYKHVVERYINEDC